MVYNNEDIGMYIDIVLFQKSIIDHRLTGIKNNNSWEGCFSDLGSTFNTVSIYDYLNNCDHLKYRINAYNSKYWYFNIQLKIKR